MSWLHGMEAWWSGGDLLMPIMGAVAVALYAILIERTIALWSVRRAAHADEVVRLLAAHRGAWASRYIALSEAESLGRGFALIRALTASLPLLGLLGTVTGMIGTFDALARAGAGSQASRAGAGIGLALTATQYGMALAIPAVVWDWALARRVRQLVDNREQAMRRAQVA